MKLQGTLEAAQAPEKTHSRPLEIKILNGACDILSPEIEHDTFEGQELSTQFHLAVLITDGLMRENSIDSYLLSANSEQELITALQDGVDVPFNMDVWSEARGNKGHVNGLTVKTKYFSPS